MLPRSLPRAKDRVFYRLTGKQRDDVVLRMFPVPFPANLQEGNNLKPSLSAVRPDQANLYDVSDRRFAVVQDGSGPKFQQGDILERSYGVTAERYTCAQERIDKHGHSEFHLSVAQRRA